MRSTSSLSSTGGNLSCNVTPSRRDERRIRRKKQYATLTTATLLVAFGDPEKGILKKLRFNPDLRVAIEEYFKSDGYQELRFLKQQAQCLRLNVILNDKSSEKKSEKLIKVVERFLAIQLPGNTGKNKSTTMRKLCFKNKVTGSTDDETESPLSPPLSGVSPFSSDEMTTDKEENNSNEKKQIKPLDEKKEGSEQIATLTTIEKVSKIETISVRKDSEESKVPEKDERSNKTEIAVIERSDVEEKKNDKENDKKTEDTQDLQLQVTERKEVDFKRISNQADFLTICMDSSGRIADNLRDLMSNEYYKLHVTPFYKRMSTKISYVQESVTSREEKIDENEMRKAGILQGISTQTKCVVDVIKQGGYVDERDKEQILLLRAKTKIYPEELYKWADILIPIISGLVLTVLCVVICYFIPGHAWLYPFAPTVGFAAGKNIGLTPAIQDGLRNVIAQLLSLFFDKGSQPLTEPVNDFLNITDSKIFPTKAKGTKSLYTSKVYNKEKMAIYEVNVRDSKDSREKHNLVLYNDERLSVNIVRATIHDELNALHDAIKKLRENNNSDLCDLFDKLHLSLSVGHNRVRENSSVSKENYLRDVTQQARFLLEALYLSEDDDEKLDHFLLLQAKAEADPEEYSWLIKYILPILVVVLITLLCMVASHYFIIGALVFDMVIGALLQPKEDNCNLVAAPTAAKYAFDYLSSYFFSNSVQNQVLSIRNHLSSSHNDLIKGPNCRVFLK